MFRSLRGATYRVANLEAAKQWYRRLLAREPALDTQLAVTFQVGDSALTLLPAEGGSDEPDERVVAYWAVEDINAAFQRMLDAGAKPQCEIMTSMLNTKLARVVDPFGNVLGITSRISDVTKTSLEHQPSDSAMGVTFFRALATFDEREEIRGPDYLAQVFLPEDYRRLLNNPSSRAFVRRRMTTQTPGSYEYFVARTAYFDRVVRQALEENIPQLVILGAGYDTRSFRFRDQIRKTRIFELDIAPTQQLKKRLLQQAGVPIPEHLTFVSIDFAKESLADALGKAGFDRLRKSLFVWEGVMYYLPAGAVDQTFRFITGNSPAGSTLCFDYLVEAADMLERYGVKESRSAMETTYCAEPVQFRIEEGTIGAFLSERGYSLVEHLTPEDLEREFLTLRDGSSAGKVLACFCLVQARTD